MSFRKRTIGEAGFATVTPNEVERVTAATAKPSTAAASSSAAVPVPVAVAVAVNTDALNNLIKYCHDDQEVIRQVVKGADKVDPIAVIKYNDAWVAENPQGQTQIRTFILNHLGSDDYNTGFVFHFHTFRDFINCGNELRVEMPELFLFSPAVIAEQKMAEPVRVGEVWVVTKVGVNNADVAEFNMFFYM